MRWERVQRDSCRNQLRRWSVRCRRRHEPAPPDENRLSPGGAEASSSGEMQRTRRCAGEPCGRAEGGNKPARGRQNVGERSDANICPEPTPQKNPALFCYKRLRRSRMALTVAQRVVFEALPGRGCPSARVQLLLAVAAATIFARPARKPASDRNETGKANRDGKYT